MTTSPEICGFYSVTADRRYEESASSLQYFIQPKLPLDLNKGIDTLRLKTDAYYQEKMDKILTFLVNHKSEFLNKTSSMHSGDRLIPSTQYITYRGILRMIMCSRVSPYPWTIIATKYKGNIYLCQYTSPEEIEKIKNQMPGLRRFCNYGLMFEHHCLSEHPNKGPDTSQVYDENKEFYCVLKRNLVNRQFLFGAAVDGTDSSTPLNSKNPRELKPNQFIELRINLELNSKNRLFSFHQVKIHRIWAQSYLAGIDKVYIGFNTNYGIVEHIRCYSIFELERISKRNWNGSRSGLELLNDFLETVENDLKDIDCPYTTIKYHHDQAIGRLSSTKREGKTEYSFLPEWYLQEMK